jgi:hypothetical protein
VEAKRLAKEQVKVTQAMRETVATLEAARARVTDWPVPDEREPLLKGLKKTYRRGRKALDDALEDPTPKRCTNCASVRSTAGITIACCVTCGRRS